MTDNANHQIRHLLVEGRVQGVGFRWHAQERARRIGLRGWVQNRSDGTVEILVSGPEDLLDRFISDLAAGPKGSDVSNVRPLQHTHKEDLPFPFAILR